jgi:hypothetical protein
LPVALDDIVMQALSPSVTGRYQRAEDFLQDLLRVRRELVRRPGAADTPPPAAAAVLPAAVSAPPRAAMRRLTPARTRTRDMTASRFCWNCRKPLPARADRCPFCSESQ